MLAAPLIKFTSTEETSDGPRRRIWFLNPARVAQAVFDESDGTLSLFFGESPSGSGVEHVLHGAEAKQALALLQKL